MKKGRWGITCFLFCLAWLFLLGCQIKPDPSLPEGGLHPAVQRTIEERVERYRKRLLQSCEDKVLEAATTRVDSLIIANAKRIKAVGGDRPAKPVRPSENGRRVPFDSTRVEPLWDLDSLLYEQLLKRRAMADSLLSPDSLLLDSLRLDSLRLDSTIAPKGEDKQ